MLLANRGVPNRENVHGSLGAIGVLHRVETCRGRVSRQNRAARWTRGRPCWQSGRTARSGWRSSRVYVSWWWRRRWCLCTVLGSNCSRFRFSCRAHLRDTKRRLVALVLLRKKYLSIVQYARYFDVRYDTVQLRNYYCKGYMYESWKHRRGDVSALPVQLVSFFLFSRQTWRFTYIRKIPSAPII